MTYTITCNKCGGSSIADIDEVNKLVTWRKVEKVISARFRFDSQWGFQCACTNNSLMTDQEKEYIKNPVQPTPQEIDDIKKNLVINVDNKFEMVGI